MSRPRVAWFSPLGPVLSGISDYSEELLPHLSELWDVDLFVDGSRPSAPELAGHRCFDAADGDVVPRLGSYDATLYHVGNSPAHGSLYRTLLRWPGLVVLHDFDLHDLMLERTAGRGRSDRYVAEMRAQYGDEAAERARRVLFGGERPLQETHPLRYPLNRRVLANAAGLLVHSRFVERLVRAERPDAPLVRLDHHALPPDAVGAVRRPEAAGGAADAGVVFVTAGYLTPAKRVELVLRALSRIRDRLRFRYRLVGRMAPGHDLRAAAERLGLADRVELVGHAEKPDLYRALLDADVCIALRRPTLGETSGIVMRALACGRPVVVNDGGWFTELPDDCCPKLVPGGADEEVRLAGLLLALGRDADRRAASSAAALRYAAQRDLPSRARGYDRLLRLARERSARGLAEQTERRLHGLGAAPEPSVCEAITARIASLDGA